MVADPLCPTSRTFMDLGAAVVREVAKMSGVQVRDTPIMGISAESFVIYFNLRSLSLLGLYT